MFILPMPEKRWRELWKAALLNMPAMAIIPRQERVINSAINGMCMTWYRSGYRRGAATALRICLGYHTYSAQGRSNAASAVYVAIRHGSKPRGAARQHLLRVLAGPHGATLARVRLIQLGQAHRFKFWPKPGH